MTLNQVLVVFSVISWSYAFNVTEWMNYKEAFQKNYSCLEDEHKSIHSFIWNSQVFGIHSARVNVEDITHLLEINYFADTEFSSFLQSKPFTDTEEPGAKRTTSKVKVVPYKARGGPLPKSHFWQIPSINNHRFNDPTKCFSGWAFAAAAAVQSARFLRDHELTGDAPLTNTSSVEMSIQQILDCSKPYGNLGCAGGSVLNALKFIAENGITSERNYPYTGKEGTCKKSTGEFKINSILSIESGNDTLLEDALVNVGLIAVTIRLPIFHYLSFYYGVMGHPICPATGRNVAALIFGYGHQNGLSYWALQAFFGSSWGEYGYFRIPRGGNFCGVASEAYIPVVD